MIDRKFVHIHVGKTGGTSLAHSLNDALGPETCSPPFVQNYMSQAEADHLAGFRVVNGHISRWDQLKWFGDRLLLTILREPIDRGLSFIHYVRSLDPASAPVAADAARLPILALIETEEAQRNLNNTVVRQLGGHLLDPVGCLDVLLEEAKRTLRGALWAGRQDRMGPGLARLSTLLETPISLRSENVTPRRPGRQEEHFDVIDRLRALSEYDQELWEWAKRELFPAD